jgi:hypothetical protein
LFWIKTYNQKARGAVVTLPDKLEDFGEAEAAAAGKTLVKALQGNNSVVPLLYDLFAGDPTAALVSFGAGVAVDSVLREGKLEYANVRLNVVEGRLYAGVDGGEPLFSGGGFEPLMRYPPFGCPPDLAPCTARRSTASVLAEAAVLRAAKPGSNVIVSVGVQCYSRAANYAPGPAVCMKAGDLLGATTVGIDGTTLGRRVLFEATKAAAAYSSTYLTQLAATGPLARCDAVWAAGHVGAGVPLAAALGASLGQSVALFRRGLVTANRLVIPGNPLVARLRRFRVSQTPHSCSGEYLPHQHRGGTPSTGAVTNVGRAHFPFSTPRADAVGGGAVIRENRHVCP